MQTTDDVINNAQLDKNGFVLDKTAYQSLKGKVSK